MQAPTKIRFPGATGRGGTNGRPTRCCCLTSSRGPSTTRSISAMPCRSAPCRSTSTTRSIRQQSYTRVNGFNCPSDADRLTDPNGHNNYMANSGSGANSMYAGNGGISAGTGRWPGRSSTRTMERSPRSAARSSRSRRSPTAEQHGRVQRANQGDRLELHGDEHRSTAASRRPRFRTRRASPTTSRPRRRLITSNAARSRPRRRRAIRTGRISSTTISRAPCGSPASRHVLATST